VDLGTSSAYVLTGPRPILIDTGTPGQGPHLVAELRRLGFDPRALSLIVLTHAHWDHLGSADEVRRLTGAPIALHPADQHHLRAGRATLQPQTFIGRLASPFFSSRTFTPFTTDVDLAEGFDLEPFGVPGTVIATPGHTPGSVSILLASGEAMVGDVIRGSFLAPDRPAPHFFAESPADIRASLRKLDQLGPARVFTGHGHPFSGRALRRHVGEMI
jgi:glyoxylase-like metal-dependent hydrolase (beta-lactamase superfamily II)